MSENLTSNTAVMPPEIGMKSDYQSPESLLYTWLGEGSDDERLKALVCLLKGRTDGEMFSALRNIIHGETANCAKVKTILEASLRLHPKLFDELSQSIISIYNEAKKDRRCNAIVEFLFRHTSDEIIQRTLFEYHSFKIFEKDLEGCSIEGTVFWESTGIEGLVQAIRGAEGMPEWYQNWVWNKITEIVLPEIQHGTAPLIPCLSNDIVTPAQFLTHYIDEMIRSMTADRYNVIDRLYINNNGKPNYDLELIIRFMGLFEQNAPAEKLYIRFDTAFEIARVLNSSFTYRVVARHLEDCGIGDELALFWLGGACLAYAPGNDAIIEAIKRKMTELRQSHSDLETRMSMIVEE